MHYLDAKQKVLPTYFPGYLFRWLIHQGYHSDSLLDNLEIQSCWLHSDNAKISFEQLKPFLAQVMKVTDNPNLGLEFGKQLQLTSMGVIGFAAMTSKTLKDAVATLNRFLQLRDPLISGHLIETEQQLTLSFDEVVDYGSIQHFMFSSIYSALSNMIRFLMPDHDTQFEACVTYSKPKTWHQNKSNIDFTLQFAKEGCTFSIPMTLAKSPLRTSDQTSHIHALRMCESERALYNPLDSLPTRIKALLNQPSENPITLEQAALLLHMSSRSLRRKLRGMDTSFKQLRDEVRKKQAKKYLLESQHNIEEIAQKVGYSDPSNFGRAFRAWFDLSPSQFREAHATRNASESD